MTFKKIKKVPFQGNNERCKVLRRLYAESILDVISKGYRVINVDESFLIESDFRSRLWKKHGLSSSLPLVPLTLKVNMIAALDTEGKVYLALTQINTDTDVMMLFMSKLA